MTCPAVCARERSVVRGLTACPSTCSIRSALGLNDKAIKRLMDLFVDDLSGKIDYDTFIKWARKQPGLCR